ncbi:molybdate ABC transporter substrate-binding protein [Maricaulis sp.]|uniref:molybdate ABC transporter substrate-binding protein n=1 Tax=Maricaulis sp. TaxID=1486257 RepID=UPI0026379C25|nr:molybdate ABC transporter substrate-binding protein [Maricaulis sp.]
MRDGLKLLLLLGLMAVSSASARADEIRVAVAANFLATARQLETAFEAEHDHEVTLIAGSTGLLYAQIVQGAPFDLLLAADQVRPESLEEAGLGVAGSRFTYAAGQLSLLVPGRQGDANELGQVLQQARRIAMAQPALAPYGLAAEQALTALGLDDETAHRRVYGLNVAQVYAVVITGNADAGFVARAATHQNVVPADFRVIDVPTELHAPVHQDAILLSGASDPIAARRFLDFLRSPPARALIESAGYSSVAP